MRFGPPAVRSHSPSAFITSKRASSKHFTPLGFKSRVWVLSLLSESILPVSIPFWVIPFLPLVFFRITSGFIVILNRIKTMNHRIIDLVLFGHTDSAGSVPWCFAHHVRTVLIMWWLSDEPKYKAYPVHLHSGYFLLGSSLKRIFCVFGITGNAVGLLMEVMQQSNHHYLQNHHVDWPNQKESLTACRTTLYAPFLRSLRPTFKKKSHCISRVFLFILGSG